MTIVEREEQPQRGVTLEQQVQDRGTDAVVYDDGIEMHAGDGGSLPIIQLVQDQSADGTAGMFRRLDTGVEAARIEAVPIMLRRTRLKWPSGSFNRDAKPECWSNDGNVPAAGTPNEGIKCVDCPFFSLQTRGGDRESGTCLNTYALGLWDLDADEPLLMRLTGTATYVAKQIVGSKSSPNPRRRVMTLYSEQIAGKSGKYHSLKVRTGRDLDDDERARAQLVYDEAMVGADLSFSESGNEVVEGPPAPTNIHPASQAAINEKRAGGPERREVRNPAAPRPAAPQDAGGPPDDQEPLPF